MAAIAVELVRRMAERWNAGDVDGMVAVCDPDVVVRPDPGLAVIEGFPTGVAGARRFFENQRDVMGPGQVRVLEEDDCGSWGLVRMRQDIHSPRGIESQWNWTLIATVRDGAVVKLEFFLDDSVARASVGLT